MPKGNLSKIFFLASFLLKKTYLNEILETANELICYDPNNTIKYEDAADMEIEEE